jgi:adenine-specific DNA methylase
MKDTPSVHRIKEVKPKSTNHELHCSRAFFLSADISGNGKTSNTVGAFHTFHDILGVFVLVQINKAYVCTLSGVKTDHRFSDSRVSTGHKRPLLTISGKL